MSAHPDLLILLGPRGLISLIGAVAIIAAVWRSDRIWDEKGSAAYERAKTSLTRGRADSTVTIPEADLNAAFPFPWPFILGWAIFGVSYLFPVDGSWEVDVSSSNAVASVAVCLTIGWIASVPMGEAVRFRDAFKKTKFSMIFVASWLLLTVVSGTTDPLLMAFRGLGAISIIASMKILWKFRKMGDTWEQDGKPNPNPIVYNMGGPLFVFGWFLFWVGMASTRNVHTEDAAIPIYFTLRSAFAFLAGCGMVPVVLLLDYAHDEGAEFTGFGTDGRYFGRFWETPIPFLFAWTLFGIASLLPFGGIDDVTPRQWIILANCVFQGIVAGVFIQTALYKGDMAGKNKFSIPFVILFVALAVELGISGGISWLAAPGAMLIIAGQKTVFGDRKRGDYWMEMQTVNPNPIVYSAGEPLFMAGWIVMSIAMAIPF